MAVFKSYPCFSNSIRDSACNAFGFDFSSGELELFEYSWGAMVEVFSGDHAGKYDAWKDDGRWIFIPA